MKILAAIVDFIVKFLAGSFLWLIVAVVLSFPLGLLMLKITDSHIVNNTAFYCEINNCLHLLYALFVITCFVGVIIARIVAVSIKVLADKKLAQKNQKT